MKNNPLISIIVPVYNVEKYLKKMIESVLNQTYQNFELIMIDDGSTDDSLKILKKYKNESTKIIVFTQENDGAPGKARNLGIKESNGEYLVFLDADDFMPKNALEILLNNFSDEVDLVIGKTIWTDGNAEWYPLTEKKLSYKNNIYDIKNIRYYDFEKVSYVVHGRMHRSSIIKKNKIFFPRKFSSQDTYFAIMYNMSCRKIKIINDVVYYRLERQDKKNKSQVQVVSVKSISGRVEVFKQIVNKLIHLNQNDLAYYFANAGIVSNYNRLKNVNLIDFQNIFINYQQFYNSLFKKSFFSTRLMFKAISNGKKNAYIKYINLIEKLTKGRIKWQKR